MECQRSPQPIASRFVAASVLVHAVAILLLPGLPQSGPPPLALSVALRAPAALPAEAEPAVAAPVPRPTASQPPSARPQPPAQRASSAAVALTTPEPSPAAPSLPASPPPAAAPATVAAAPVAPEAPPAAAPIRARAGSADAAPDRERRGHPSTLWLAGYTQAISGQVERRKAYPPLARARGWQGTTVVAVQLAADGSILHTRIEQSSGHEVLDQQALAMVRLAGPLPPYPERHDGDPLTLQLPIVFALASAR